MLLVLLMLFLFLLPSPAHAANSGNFTMSLWVKPTTSVSSKAIIGKAEEFRVFTDASGYVGCQIKTSTWQTSAQSASKGLSLGGWSHVVCTYDLTSLKVYVDGVLVKSSALTSLPDDTANQLKIGQDDSASTPYGNLIGTIDEFKFYNYALTEEEILTDYNSGSSLILGSLSDNSSYQKGAANQEYCIPGDTTSCAAPVGEWKFEEGNGGSVYDSSGNGNTGTWYGTGSRWTTGKVGKAGKFNGSDDYVDVANESNFDFMTNSSETFTIGAWIKTSSNDLQTILAKVNTFNTPGFQFRITNYDGQMRLNYAIAQDGNNYKNYHGTTAINDGTWKYIVLVLNSGTPYMYINGVSDTVTVGASGGTVTTKANNENVKIGTRGNLAFPFNGQIDQVRIFNYARTPAQIAWDYNRGAPVAHWDFDECQGNTVYDQSPNKNNGTITVGSLGSQASLGTCAANAATAWYNGRTGKRNSSLSFDGTDDYASVPDSSSWTLGADNFTFELWTKLDTLSQDEWWVAAFLAHDEGAGAKNKWIFSYDAATDKYVFHVNTPNGSVNFAIRSNVLNFVANVWYHVTLTRSGNVYTFYKDGVAVGSVTQAGTIPDAATPLTVGWGEGSGGFDGLIDEVKIYNYALTPLQVKMLYNNGAVNFGPVTGSP